MWTFAFADVLLLFIHTEREKMKKKLLSIALSALLLMGTISSVNFINSEAEEAYEVFYIKHKHVGSKDASSDCYSKPHYHTHAEPANGECYTPRYHEHSGSEASEGGCYTVPVLHYHTGDSSKEGGCYVAKYHEHDGNCYSRERCEMTHTEELKGTVEKYCGYHGQTMFLELYVYYRHSSCGTGYGGAPSVIDGCSLCGVGGYETYHYYNRLNCPLPENTIIGYVLGCNHAEGDVDHYEPGCNMEGVIEDYFLSCTKTVQDIDYYELDCDIENVAKIVVTKKPLADGETEVNLSLEDLSDGTIDLSDFTVKWQDNEGNELGQDTSLTVKEDGQYDFFIETSSPKVDETSLNGSIEIKHIREETNGNGGKDNFGEDEGSPGQGDASNQGDTNGSDDTVDGSLDGSNKVDSSGNKDIKQNEEAIDMNESADDVSARRKTKNDSSEYSKDDMYNSASELYELGDEDENENETVMIDETYDENEELISVDEKQETDITDDSSKENVIKRFGRFLKTVPGKIISISLSTLALISAVAFMFVFFSQVAVIYNYDSDNKRHLLGFERIVLKNEGYELNISEDVALKAYTNRFEFTMRLFALLHPKDTDIVVTKNDKRSSIKALQTVRLTI